jgi:hypothetical protein
LIDRPIRTAELYACRATGSTLQRMAKNRVFLGVN